MVNLYSLIQQLCIQRNITIALLERECSLGNGTIKKWGDTIPSADRLKRVADYFSMTIDYLLGESEEREINMDEHRKSMDWIASSMRTSGCVTVIDPKCESLPTSKLILAPRLTDNKKSSLSERLQELRKDFCLSQHQLANYLRVSRSTVSMWEIGASEPSISQLCDLAIYFNVSLEYLLGY